MPRKFIDVEENP